MATIIIVLKMTYGLDGRPRYRRLSRTDQRIGYDLWPIRLPDKTGDPVLSLPRVDKWLARLKELNEFDAATRDALFSSENAL
jgi:RNA polymerase I-specific transcription initiation factor RRN7